MTTQPITQEQHAVREVAACPAILPSIIEQTALAVFEKFSERLKAGLNGRQERALQLALGGHVTHKANRIFSVRSQSGQHTYMVNLDRKYCTCPDSRKGHLCKHRLAAYLIEQANQATDQSYDKTIEKVRKLLKARSDFLQEAIIYATLSYEGQSIKVEIIDLDGEAALVRALPKIQDGELKPLFPFPEQKSCTRVMAKSLTEIQIYR